MDTSTRGPRDVPVDLRSVGRAFGLPAELEVVAFHGGDAGGAWQLRDGAERAYSLKVAALPVPPWTFAYLRDGGLLERRAFERGLDIVEPLTPPDPEVGLCRRVGDHLAWMHRWAEVVPAADQAPAGELHRWLGRTLAGLHTLVPAGPADGDLPQVYGLHPPADWRAWIAQAERLDLAWSAPAAEALPAIVQAGELVASALDDPEARRCVTHRDVNPWNVLHTGRGPVLCDFGYAGVDLPWFETVATALSFGAGPAILEAYVEAGGRPGTRSAEALAGHLGGALSWLAFNVWLSLGHRPVGEQRRTRATENVPALCRALVDEVDSLDETVRALAAAGG